MKEFMKQTDVASEFLKFLREANLYDEYLDEFKKEFHECGFGSKERCMKIFSEVNQNLEDYMLSLTEKEQIINLKLSIYARVLSIPKPNAYSTYVNSQNGSTPSTKMKYGSKK